jgi:uncharacterized alkaline shock family protein YloU
MTRPYGLGASRGFAVKPGQLRLAFPGLEKLTCDVRLPGVSNRAEPDRGDSRDLAVAACLVPLPISRKRDSQMTESVPALSAEPARMSAGASELSAERRSADGGKVTIDESVVQKIAGIACREISGVHVMGVSTSRAFGAVRERIPGSSGPNVAQGVGVEVGETEAAIDLDIVVEYGVSIADLGRSIQRNVKQAVERMTGLDVVEVNINVDDLYLPGDDDQQQDSQSRVS